MTSISSTIEKLIKIKAEENFFYNNPELGTFVSWPIFGSKIDINTLNDTGRRDLIANYSNVPNDKLFERIPYIHRMVHPDFPPETPTAYLFHCSQGVYRAGEVAGSYVMTYQNKAMMEVYAWDQEVSERDITLENQYGLKEYCWFLTYENGYTYLKCEQFKNRTM